MFFKICFVCFFIAEPLLPLTTFQLGTVLYQFSHNGVLFDILLDLHFKWKLFRCAQSFAAQFEFIIIVKAVQNAQWKHKGVRLNL